MSEFNNLLSENMKNRFFPRGATIYGEGEKGDHMYFINSGAVDITTRHGSSAVRRQGDFFGEGALLHPRGVRSCTIRCKTPVHAMEISREYFDRYLSASESGLLIALKEKDKIRKRNHTKSILRLQNNLRERRYAPGEAIFQKGDGGDTMFIAEQGKVELILGDRHVFSATAGNVFGEHSVITGRDRNCSAFCSPRNDDGGGCVVQELLGTDFRKLADLSPDIKTSLRDLCRRRDFKKAIVHRLQKEFPYHDPREAFDAVRRGGGERKGRDGNDDDDVGEKDDDILDVEDIGRLMKEMDPNYADEEIREVIETIDLTNTGDVSYNEFMKVFIADLRTSASM